MAQTLELIIKARDEATKELNKIKGNFDSLKSALPVIGAAALTYVGVLKTSAELAQGYIDYVIAAGDLASKTGMGIQEATAILQLAETTGLSVSELVTAFSTMAKNDIEPSIDGLIEVKTRLDEAGTPAERLALAVKLLGQTGGDLIPILNNLGSDGLIALKDGMAGAIYPTEEEYKKMLALRDTMGEFNQNLDKFKLILGEQILDKTGIGDIIANWNNLLSGTIGYMYALQTYLGVTPSQVAGIPSRQTQWGPQRPATSSPAGWGGVYGTGGYAMGGWVPAAGGYMVGEHGAERFTPGTPGTISPNNDQLTQEIRRMLRTLPVILRDAVEKAK